MSSLSSPSLLPSSSQSPQPPRFHGVAHGRAAPTAEAAGSMDGAPTQQTPRSAGTPGKAIQRQSRRCRQPQQAKQLSVQRQYVPFKALLGTDVLVIRGLGDAGTATTLPAASDLFRAVLEVGSVNYALFTPQEQDALIERYRALIAALAFPIQILVRVLPLDLEPYLQALARQVAAYHRANKQATSRIVGSRGEPEQAEQAERPIRTETDDRLGHDLLLHLAHDHMQHVRSLAVQRGLLERHFYLVIPATNLPSASGDDESGRGGAGVTSEAATETLLASLRGLSRALFPMFPQRRRRTALVRAFQQQVVARQQLDLRCADLIRQLSAMRLEARRLRGAELVDLAYSCLTPIRARHSPMSPDRLRTVDLPPIARFRSPHESGGNVPAHMSTASDDGLAPPAPPLARADATPTMRAPVASVALATAQDLSAGSPAPDGPDGRGCLCQEADGGAAQAHDTSLITSLSGAPRPARAADTSG